MKVVFVTSLLSPFQLETARAINELTRLKYEVLFALPFREARGRHWQEGDFSDIERQYAVVPSGRSALEVRRWLLEELRARKPELVLSGALHGPMYAAVRTYFTETGTPWGSWLEQPDPRRHWLRRLAVKVVMTHRLRGASFSIGIGERARQYFGALTPRSAMVTYGQDLSPCFATPPKPRGRPMAFVYSGQLLPRQNIGLIMEAARRVLALKGPAFRLIVAARGPEQSTIDAALKGTPDLETVLSYDRDYQRWNDRLRPMAESDVLVYPSLHSGWGLVIPEAMACGCKVITTRMVEAARYFIRDGINGVFIEPSVDELVRAWVQTLEDPEGTRAMGERAREDAHSGDARYVAAQLEKALAELL